LKSIENKEGTSTPKIDGLDLSVFLVLLRIVLVDSIFFPIIEELVETEVAGFGSKCSELAAEFTPGSEVTADSGSEFNKEMRLSILDGGGLAPGLEKVFGAKELVPVIMVVLLLLFNPIFTWLIVS
jgi:hypothetical protein